MSTTWDAPLAHRLRPPRSRNARVPPVLTAVGRALLYLAWAALMAWAILFRPAGLAAQEATDAGDAAIVAPVPLRS